MQTLKPLFSNPNLTKHGSCQSCIRTVDLELVGDGSHLTSFKMIGNFNFGLNNYEESVEIWDEIIAQLNLRRSITSIQYHPDRDDMRLMWTKRGYVTIPNKECIWSDGNISGYCTEMFVGDLEIGNLVNPLGHSTDVGFGLERIIQVVEGLPRVDDSTLFRTDLHPIVRDHIRTLELFWKYGIEPGNKGRNYVCRRLIRRILPLTNEMFVFNDWMKSEREQREKCFKLLSTKWNKFKDRDEKFWWETFGILPEEIGEVKNGN